MWKRPTINYAIDIVVTRQKSGEGRGARWTGWRVVALHGIFVLDFGNKSPAQHFANRQKQHTY